MTSRKSSRHGRRRSSGRWRYHLAGLLLWLLCLIAGRCLWRLLGAGTRPWQDHAGSSAAWYFYGGVTLWLVLYGFMPRPVRLYVLGHELTHALAAWISGGAASRLRVGPDGGSVTVTSHNFLVVLAPYFVPFYAVLLLTAYAISSLWIDPRPWHPLWIAALGLCWGFHLAFTVSALSRPQEDLRAFGPFFSYGLIVFCNLLCLTLGLIWLAAPDFNTLSVLVAEETRAVAAWPRVVTGYLAPVWDTIIQGWQSLLK